VKGYRKDKVHRILDVYETSLGSVSGIDSPVEEEVTPDMDLHNVRSTRDFHCGIKGKEYIVGRNILTNFETQRI
jgi:hypothetical protein